MSGHVTFGTGVLGSPNGDYWVVFGLGGQSNYRGNTAVDLMILRRRPQPALSLQIDPYKHRDTGTSVRVIPVGQPAHITIEGGVPGLDVYVTCIAHNARNGLVLRSR